MNLAFIDPGLRKARFLLELRHHLGPEIQCFYYSRRRVVRTWIESAGCTAYPLGPSAQREFPISDAELRLAVGPKELTLRGEQALQKARKLLSELASFLDESRADAIFLWNGSNLLLALAKFVAQQRGVPIVFAEHGYLPGTLQIDLNGVNYESSLTDRVMNQQARLPPDPKLDALIDAEIAAHRAGKRLRAAENESLRKFRTDVISKVRYFCNAEFKKAYRRRLWHLAHKLGLDSGQPLPQRFVFVPLQVQKDSQLILHSPLVGNDLRALLSMTLAAVKEVDPDLGIVAKLHPREQPHVQRRNLDLIREFPGIRFVSKPPINELLSKAAAVVTINSTVGFEAFLYDKPVIALGENFYTAPHLVEVVRAKDDLSGALRRAIRGDLPHAERRAFLRYVYARFLVFGNYDDYSERSLRAVAERIRALLLNAAPHTALIRKSV